MARGLMTALQAALAGVSGGATGYAQYQRQQKEEQARQQELERQRVRDVLAQSQFDLSKKEFEARFGPEAVARQERQRQEDLAARAQERAEDNARAIEVARIQANAASARDAAELAQKQKAQQDTAEAWWNTTVIRSPEEFAAATPERKATAARAAQAFDRIRSSPGGQGRPAREIIQAVYEAEQDRLMGNVRRQQATGLPVPPEPAPSGYLSPRGQRPTSQAAGSATMSPADRWQQIFDELLSKGMGRSQAAEEATRRVRG